MKFLNKYSLSMYCGEEDGLFTEREGNGGNRAFFKKGLDGYSKSAYQPRMELGTN
jgi:hypothetical protein